MWKSFVGLSGVLLIFAACRHDSLEEKKSSYHVACMDQAQLWINDTNKANKFCDELNQYLSTKYTNLDSSLEHIDALAKDTVVRKLVSKYKKGNK